MSKISVNVVLWSLFVLANSELEPVPPSPLLIQSATGRPRGGAHPPAPPPPDCSSVRCPSGSSCEMISEPCRSPPCSNPIPECRPIVLSPPAAPTTAAPPVPSTASSRTPPRPSTTTPPTRSPVPSTQSSKSLTEPSRPPIRRQPEQAPPSVPSQKPTTAVVGRSPPSSSPPRPQQKGVPTSALLPLRNDAKVKSAPPSSANVQQGISSARSRFSNAASRPSSPTSRRNSAGKSSTATCSGVVCPFGSVCRIVDSTPQCDFPTAEQRSPPARITSTSSPISSNFARSRSSPSRPPTSSCSGVVCPVGSSCHIVNGIPQCGFSDPFPIRRAPSNSPCMNVKCPAGTVCQVVNLGAKLQAQCISSAAQLPCPRNETWQNCSSRCEPTCEQRNPKCSQKCGVPRCQCDPGFFRDRTGKCKPLSQC